MVKEKSFDDFITSSYAIWFNRNITLRKYHVAVDNRIGQWSIEQWW